MRYLTVALLLVLLGGCGGRHAQATNDCNLAIRTGDVVYVEAGFVKGLAHRDGQAEYASCDDNGEGAKGVYFPEDAHIVRVWSFEGEDRRTVLGVRQGSVFRVFVAEGRDAEKAFRDVRQSLQREGS